MLEYHSTIKIIIIKMTNKWLLSCNNDNNLRIYDVIELCVFITQFIRIVFTFYRIQILQRTRTHTQKKKNRTKYFYKNQITCIYLFSWLMYYIIFKHGRVVHDAMCLATWRTVESIEHTNLVCFYNVFSYIRRMYMCVFKYFFLKKKKVERKKWKKLYNERALGNMKWK